MTPIETTDLNETAEQTPTTNEETQVAVAPEKDEHDGHEHAEHDPAGHTHAAPTLNPELMREIAVEVPAEEVTKSFKAVTKRIQRMARIPGFRIGKVPESVIRAKFMKEIRQEILEGLVSERFRQAIDEAKMRPVSQPQIADLNLFEGQPLRFKATFEVLPEFDVSGYDTVQVKRPDSALTEEEYAAELERALEPHATVEPVEEDRSLVDGDWAEIGFAGKIKDLAQTVGEDGIESVSAAAPITGEGVLIQVGGKNTLVAFTDALRGATPGQELEFEVNYPADFGEAKLAGQTVGYDVTVKAIKRKTFPEKDAEFAKQLGNYEDWNDFEVKLREQSQGRKTDALENGARDEMVDEIVKRYDFPVPETFVQQQVDARLDRGLRALAQQGMKAEDMRKLDFNRLRAAQRDTAVSEVKASLILDRIADAEGVLVTDEELNNEVLMMSFRSRESCDAVKDRLTRDGGMDRMREQMRREKTGSVLFEKLARN